AETLVPRRRRVIELRVVRRRLRLAGRLLGLVAGQALEQDAVDAAHRPRRRLGLAVGLGEPAGQLVVVLDPRAARILGDRARGQRIFAERRALRRVLGLAGQHPRDRLVAGRALQREQLVLRRRALRARPLAAVVGLSGERASHDATLPPLAS